MLEEKEPLSWLKSVVAFANTDGGALIYGIADDDTVVGLDNPKYVSDKISEFIRNRVDPSPEIQLSFETVKDENKAEKVLVILYVHAVQKLHIFTDIRVKCWHLPVSEIPA